jgi:FkbM family methyltransferase
VRCRGPQAAEIARAKPIAHSNCFDNRAWMDVLLRETAHLPAVTVVAVGCNKGDDFVAQMRDWSGDPRFSVSEYRASAARHFPRASARACPPGSATTVAVPRRAARGFCVEPMPRNYQLLETCMRALRYLGPVTLVPAAVSSVPGEESFPDGDAGAESLGLGHASAASVRVNVTTLDEIVRGANISAIEFLSIDTEGNDVRALLGGIHTLAARKVRYLEFEYHKVGRWALSDLQDLVDLLDQLGFDCYWALNSGGLSRLTGCWHDSYYSERFWSNVACVDRESRQTHRAMQRLAGFA